MLFTKVIPLLACRVIVPVLENFKVESAILILSETKLPGWLPKPLSVATSNIPPFKTVWDWVFVPVNFKVPLPDLTTLPLLTTPDIVEVTPLAVSNVIFWPPRFTAPEKVLLLFDVIVYLSPEIETSPDKVKAPLFVASPIVVDDVMFISLLIERDDVFEDDIPPPSKLIVLFVLPNDPLFPIPTKPPSMLKVLEITLPKFELFAFKIKVPSPCLVKS